MPTTPACMSHRPRAQPQPRQCCLIRICICQPAAPHRRLGASFPPPAVRTSGACGHGREEAMRAVRQLVSTGLRSVRNLGTAPSRDRGHYPRALRHPVHTQSTCSPVTPQPVHSPTGGMPSLHPPTHCIHPRPPHSDMPSLSPTHPLHPPTHRVPQGARRNRQMGASPT